MTKGQPTTKKEVLRDVAIGSIATAFGAYALYLGHNSVVISSVFFLLGSLLGIEIGHRRG